MRFARCECSVLWIDKREFATGTVLAATGSGWAVAERLFVSQGKLEAWVEGAKVTFQDNVLTLLAEKVSYRLEPAARILRVLDGLDRAGLVGKALTIAELTAQKAEHYRDSVILGDTAYECEEGFMGTAESVVSAPEPASVAAPPTAPAVEPEAADNSADLLAEFMLKHL